MAHVNIPMALGPVFWDKQKAALAKAPKTPPSKLGDELKALTRLHTGMQWDGKAFSADKLDSADDAKDRSAEFESAVASGIKALLAQLQTVVAAAAKFETEAKKDKAFPKEPLVAIAAIDKAAKEYRTDVDAFVVAVRKALGAKAAALASQKPKDGGASTINPKTFKLVRSSIVSTIAMLRKPKKGEAGRPIRYLIVQGKASAGVMLGVAVGPSQVKLLSSMMPDEGPYKIFKYAESSVIWEKNALTFVCDSLGGGVLKKVQAWLKKTLKLNVKMRLRTHDGVVAEETEGEDLSDEMLKLDPADALSADDAAQQYQERLAALAAAIKKAMAQPMGVKIKNLMGSSALSAKANKFDAALADLDEIEALLDEGGLSEPVDTGNAAAQSASAADNGAEAKKAALEQAMTDWKTRRVAAVASLKMVAAKIAAAKHASSTKAILEIQAVMKNLTAEPSTLQQLTELRKWLGTDDVVNDVCELAEDVRTPLMIPLERMFRLMSA